ncbi:unnamed protein product [Notodromas monacha]|uniref:Cytosol aminopeptidase n=1 Tax=Notodromas monacha TaxID=399045 RepID=A0A7R9GDD7_9CRUS|nr:unnamed protein product [Notodromas monacha]CAG0918429.1 unnamed protein product [Notodromas monacha]
MFNFRPQAALIKEGKNRILWNFSDQYDAVALACIGKKDREVDEIEQRHAQKEAVRIAAAGGCRALWEGGSKSFKTLEVDVMEDPEAAAEAVHLALWSFDTLKQSKVPMPEISPLSRFVGVLRKSFQRMKSLSFFVYSEDAGSWNRGKITAECQNFARYLSEMPANLMTPTVVAKEAKAVLEPLGVTVNAHDHAWAKAEKMGSFLSVATGSSQPPVFLEMIYQKGNAKDAPIVLVGKGITFDSGGISLKTPSSSMMWMRGDMGGGAAVIGAMRAIAALKLNVNVVALVPLAENMIGGSATKVMDVVVAKNGKSIEVGNTDAEGRLVLADALTYAGKFSPKVIVDVATLTGAIRTALGPAASGVFTAHTKEWKAMKRASIETGDRVWRMPLWDYHRSAVVDGHLADVSNVGNHEGNGGACIAAAFLKEFVPKGVPWMHMDIAAASRASTPSDPPYYVKGFTGRPVRTLLRFVMDHD